MKPKFTLRDLFWLVLVTACLCGWWLEHRGAAQSLATVEQSRSEWKRQAVYFADFLEAIGYRVELDGSATPTSVGEDEG